MRTVWAGLATCVIAGSAVLATAQPAVACTPLPPLVTCPPPPPTPSTYSRPTASISGVSDVTFHSVTLTAAINPGNLPTNYTWTVNDHLYTSSYRSAEGAIAASSNTSTVTSTVSGLKPGTTYDVSLYAENSAGDVSVLQPRLVTTPSQFTMILVRPTRNAEYLGSNSANVEIVLSGEYGIDAPLDLYVRPASQRRWHLSNSYHLPRAGVQTIHVPVCAFGTACQWQSENFKVRAVFGAEHTRAVQEYVYPQIIDDVTRERYGTSPWLDAILEATIHRQRGRYRSQPVFFYDGPSRRGPFTRMAVSRFHRRAATVLIARARILDPHAGVTFGCFRHQLVPDMGTPFTARWCGRRYLPRR
jgi:hypothetical protein